MTFKSNSNLLFGLISKEKFVEDNTLFIRYRIGNLPFFLKIARTYDGKKKFYFMDRCFLSTTYKTPKIQMSFDLRKMFSFPAEIASNTKADLIIPIYNGYEYLENLFESVKKNTDVDYRLIVINDESTDERIFPLLKKYEEIFSSKMLLINNDKNLGFVKSVNKALSLASEHVILLNSDVVVPKNWATRLLYPILKNDKVASVTPFSNAATIFSLPKNCFDNEFYGDLERVNEEISKLNFPAGDINLPTGVGFCMAMSKRALQEVGAFDEIFEKGYGEENDWCQRAIEKGFINTIAPNLFVWHKHGGSFDSQEKQKYIKHHIQIIRRKYPTYQTQLQELSANDSYLSVRFFAELLYLKSIAPNIQVWFDHSLGGGTKYYMFNKIKELQDSNVIVRVQNAGRDLCKISYYYNGLTNETYVWDINEVEILIRQLVPKLIVVNNLARYKDIFDTLKMIERTKLETGVKVSFRAHDLQVICPSITMINSLNSFCNCKNRKDCIKCFNNFDTLELPCESIEVWHEKWEHFLDCVVDEIIAFSNSTRELILNFYPNTKDKFVIIPHSIPTLRKVKIPPHKTLNIGVLGSIGISKGFTVLCNIAGLLPEYPEIKIVVIGDCYRKRLKNIKILGRYVVDELPDIVEREKIDIILIPSIWPETFSYTTSEALSMGLPVACFNLGAPAERLKNTEQGCIISKIDARTALEEISEFMKNYKSNV